MKMLAKRIFLMLCVCILSMQAFAETGQVTWRQTAADVTVVKNPKDLKTEGTVFGELLKQTDRSLWSLIEQDGKTILTIVITYKVAGQTITQMGFYRTVDLAVQQALEVEGILWKPVTTNIVYQSNNPLTIMFILNGALVKAPALIVESKNEKK